jgi:hypothetical protein
MLRAIVYSLEPLTPDNREAVHEGIEMVAEHIGQTVSCQELLVRLPMTDRGTVNPDRVGRGKLDKMVELHLMAVPLDRGAGERAGLAEIGAGWAFVDIREQCKDAVRTTSAHETSHALGFVSRDAAHTDPNSRYHYRDNDCIMSKSSTVLVTYPAFAPATLGEIMSSRLLRRQPKVKGPSRQLLGHHDFCPDCKVDMRANGENKLAELRHSRIFTRKGV